MENLEKESETTPTALQSTNVAVTRPKWIIGGAVVIALIVILLEIYAPRSKTPTADGDMQQDPATIPASTEPSEDGMDDHNP